MIKRWIQTNFWQKKAEPKNNEELVLLLKSGTKVLGRYVKGIGFFTKTSNNIDIRDDVEYWRYLPTWLKNLKGVKHEIY